MDRVTISSWVRQSRHRARKHHIVSDLEVGDVNAILVEHDNKCGYCDSDAETFDHPFPLKDKVPNVPANVLPACKKCKRLKKTSDIIWMYNNLHISQDVYIKIVTGMINRRGGAEIKGHMKQITGIIDE